MNGDHASQEWVPLLVPDMPSPQVLMPWLERMHAARHYSNFGPLVRELESEFARRFDMPTDGLTTVSNATLGLELVLQALDLAPGSRVLLPAFTFVATATAVVRAGHVPVLADVDPDCWLLTPDMARAACSLTRVDAVLPVATFGMPHDMQAWQQFEQDTGLPVVIDAAAAYGSQWLRGAQGTLVFSLHTTKSLPAGEGGLVVSTRPGLAARVRQLSNFGINLDPRAGLPLGSLASMGTNAKMSEYHAAIGLASLQVWEAHAGRRLALQNDLMLEVDQVFGPGLVWQAPGTSGFQMAPTVLCPRLPDAAARLALEQACQAARITTRRWYQPLLQEMGVLRQRCMWLQTPNAQALAQTLLGLPFFLGLTLGQRLRLRDAIQSARCSEH
ncbi:MAG: DegT/DnrJ/EryC1/StrS family aminotransferase [Burkholderiaceae bacterium]|jgi:dTDP-4-amino-4,6-dideoxygalactose transaminase|nr:DegT/DnrJ/EryC1/StrS family aminotransferase [Burkholderiaceae bacterium]